MRVDSDRSWRPLPPFIRRTLGWRARRRYRYDDVIPIRIAESTYLLTHPDDVQHVLVGEPTKYEKVPELTSERGRRRAGRGLLTATGDEHLRRRRLLQPLFHRRAVERFERAMASRAEARLGQWSPGMRLDLTSEMEELTRHIILSVLFVDLSGEDRAALAAAIRDRRRYTDYVYHGVLPFRDRLPTRVVRRHRRAMRTFDQIVYREIRRRRQTGRSDLTTELIDLRRADDSGLNDEQIRDEILTFTSTGYETLGEALAWATWLVERHPAVRERVLGEIEDRCGSSDPDAADAARLPYLEQVMTETMRLYPPTWIFARVSLASDRLPSGREIQGGATLLLCQYLLHRHPRYFVEPERFAPDRFDDEGPPRHVYLPFGDGSHRCIGEHLARLEGTLILARVVRRFRLVCIGDERPDLRGGITLRPRSGLPVLVEAAP